MHPPRNSNKRSGEAGIIEHNRLITKPQGFGSPPQAAFVAAANVGIGNVVAAL